ncbi:MAG: hypothetical protein Tsb0013_03610 [Phycisphaerales bacterium]
MTHLIVLLMVVAVGAASGDASDVSWVPGWARGAVDTLRAHSVTATLVGFVCIAGVAGLVFVWCSRRLDRTGRALWVRTADRALLLGQWGIVLWLAFSCFALGWVGRVRAWTGDLVILDEALALTPAPLTLCALWLLFWPIERRVREATQFGRLERGEPVHPIPGRWAFVVDQVRTHAGPVLIAALLLFGWIETVDRLRATFADRLGDRADTVSTVVLGLGAIGIVGALPLLWRVIWRTRRLPPGELRDELHALCARHRVRVADLLIWETRGALLNGALVGVLPHLRYILLTDALLERLSAREVEAVMAHEIAHARHRHIPWLIGTVIVSVGLLSSLVSLVVARIEGLPEGWHAGLGGLVSIVSAILVLGWVSRRFEQQADAFAAQHLARARTDETSPIIDGADARGMSDALGAVARFNHIPPAKFSYRHGSIRARQRRLEGLVGKRTTDVPVDRLVRWLKRTVIVGAITTGLLLWRFPEAGTLL